MSLGSDSSGEDLVAGRWNRAEENTISLADIASGQPNFIGPAILIVDVAKDLDNSEWDTSDYEDGDSFTPPNQLNGIMAEAWSGSGPVNTGYEIRACGKIEPVYFRGLGGIASNLQWPLLLTLQNDLAGDPR